MNDAPKRSGNELLSEDAIDRVLAGEEGEEKARSFQKHLEENPDADAALEKYRRAGEQRNVYHTGLQRLEEKRKAEDPGDLPAATPKDSERRNRLPVLLALIALLFVGVFVFVRFGSTPETRANESSATSAMPAPTATEVPSVTETGTRPTETAPSATTTLTATAKTSSPAGPTSTRPPTATAAPPSSAVHKAPSAKPAPTDDLYFDTTKVR